MSDKRILLQNLSVFIIHYCNKRTLDNFEEEQKAELELFRDLPSRGSTAATLTNKKLSRLPIAVLAAQIDEPVSEKKIYVQPQYKKEIVFDNLLSKLMSMFESIQNNEGAWRDHVMLVSHLEKVIHLFYLPEIHVNLVPILDFFLNHGC